MASTGLICVYRSDFQYLEAGSADNFFIRILVLASRGSKLIEDCISLSLQTARQMMHVAPQLKCECSVPFPYVILDDSGTVHLKQKNCDTAFLIYQCISDFNTSIL